VLDHGLHHWLIEARVAVLQDTVTIDDGVEGNKAVTIKRIDNPGRVGENRMGQAVGVDPGQTSGFINAVADCEYDESFTIVGFPDCLQMRSLRIAAASTKSPEVQHDHLARVIGQ
jgi:hypothetical protein